MSNREEYKKFAKQAAEIAKLWMSLPDEERMDTNWDFKHFSEICIAEGYDAKLQKGILKVSVTHGGCSR